MFKCESPEKFPEAFADLFRRCIEFSQVCTQYKLNAAKSSFKVVDDSLGNKVADGATKLGDDINTAMKYADENGLDQKFNYPFTVVLADLTAEFLMESGKILRIMKLANMCHAESINVEEEQKKE